MASRFASALAASAGALLVLTACAPGAVELGAAQEIELEDEDSNTEAKVAITITSVEQQTIDALSEFNLDEEDLARTPYFVNYELELLEGDIGPDYSPFSVAFFATSRPTLGATDADGNQAIAMQLIGGLDACKGVEDDAFASLTIGESAGGCRVFLADSDKGLRTVSFGKLDWNAAGN